MSAKYRSRAESFAKNIRAIGKTKDANEVEEDHHTIVIDGVRKVPNQYKGHKKWPPVKSKGGLPGLGAALKTRSRQRAHDSADTQHHRYEHDQHNTHNLHRRHLWHGDKDDESEILKKGASRMKPDVDTKIADIDLENLGIEYKEMGFIDEGDFMGHDALMRGGFHKATVVATRPCSIYSLKRSAITQLLREHPAIGAILQTALSRCIDTMQKELGETQLHQSPWRVLEGREREIQERDSFDGQY